MQYAGRKKFSKFLKESIKDKLLALLKYLVTPIAWLFNRYLSRKKLFVLYRLAGSSLGDSIAMSSAVRCISEDLHCKVILFIKSNDEIFHGNTEIARLYCYARMNRYTRSFIKSLLHMLQGSHVASYDAKIAAPGAYMLTHRPHSVVLNTMHIPGLQWKNLKPLIMLSDSEKKAVREKCQLPASYAVIKPSGKTTVTTKKEWDLDKFQQVVDRMPQIRWVQPGLPEDPLLHGVIDLRGKTNLRELLCIVAESQFVLTIEGLYNHIGAAFDVPSFVVLSGFFYPESFTYESTVMISQDDEVPCAPCFLDGNKDCPIPGKPCMAQLSPGIVVTAIENQLREAGATQH